MIKKLIINIYRLVPIAVRETIGNSKFLKPLRDILLRSKGIYKEARVIVKKEYSGFEMKFDFFASIKVASQAKNRGIENTILNNSIVLFRKFGNNKKDAVVLDVGANFGYLSLVWANSISKNGKVISFEPNPNVFKSLNKSIATNKLDSIIQSENKAVGKNNGQIDLYLNSTTSNTKEDHSNHQNKISIEMISLDTFMENLEISNIDLVKIDVDGIELDILKGSEDLIEKYRPIFIVEINGDEKIIEFFNQNSYEILDMELNVFQSGAQLPLNIFCVPKDK